MRLLLLQEQYFKCWEIHPFWCYLLCQSMLLCALCPTVLFRWYKRGSACLSYPPALQCAHRERAGKRCIVSTDASTRLPASCQVEQWPQHQTEKQTEKLTWPEAVLKRFQQLFELVLFVLARAPRHDVIIRVQERDVCNIFGVLLYTFSPYKVRLVFVSTALLKGFPDQEVTWVLLKCLDLEAYLHVQWLRYQHVSAYSLRKTSGNTKDESLPRNV